MKKLILLFATFAFAISAFAAESDGKNLEIKDLPKAAQELINTYFSDLTVAQTSMEKTMLGTSYSVFFENGSKMKFNKKGDWKEIVHKPGVPKEVVPKKIWEDILSKFPGRSIQIINHEKVEWEIALNDGTKLTYNAAYKLVGMKD